MSNILFRTTSHSERSEQDTSRFREKPLKLNLGCGSDIRAGWVNVDRVRGEGVDLVGDISDPSTFDILDDNSVAMIEMSHILEHISDPLPMMEALHRVAMPGCVMSISVPHGACDMAFADPQHVRQYFPASFQFFAQPSYKRADYGYTGDWDTMQVLLRVDPDLPDEIMQDEERLTFLTSTHRNVVWEMKAVLVAVKPARAVSAPFEYNPKVAVERCK